MQNGLRKRVYDMEAQELRIGNKIWRPCCYDEVVEIRENGIIGLDSLRGIIPYSEIEPIPITEELLLKNGFKKGWNGYFNYRECNDELSIRFCENYTYIEYANLCFNPEDVTETNYSSSLEFPNTLHLHTLQNIWHLLTGKELEIKL